MSAYLNTSTDMTPYFDGKGCTILLSYGKILANLDNRFVSIKDNKKELDKKLKEIKEWQEKVEFFFEVERKRASLKSAICRRDSEKTKIDIIITSVVAYLFHKLTDCEENVHCAIICNIVGQATNTSPLEIRRKIMGLLVSGGLLKVANNDDGYNPSIGLHEDFLKRAMGDSALICPKTVAELQLKIKKEQQKVKPPTQGNVIIPAQQMYEDLRQQVIGQDRQLSLLCSEGYLHCLRRNALLQSEKNGNKDNDIIYMGNRVVIIAGPSGCGKSYSVSNYSRRSGLCYVDYPATSITAQGYVGSSVESPLNILLEKSGNDMAKARFSILLLDEADKIGMSEGSSISRDIGGSCVQNELLKLCEGGNIELDTTWRRRNENGARVFSTVGLMTVFCGAFIELEDRIKYLKKKNGGLGFSDNTISKKNPVLYEGLLTYFIPELVNRVSLFLMFSPLTVFSLMQICMRSKMAYNRLLTSQGLSEIDIEPKSVRKIAEFCAEGKNPLQARGIKGILGRLIHEVIMSPSQKGGKIMFGMGAVTRAIEGYLSMEELSRPDDIVAAEGRIQAEEMQAL